MKTVLCILLALLMLTAGAAALATDDSLWDFDTYNYSLDGYLGTDAELVIPETIQNCTVDIIGLNAFNSCSGITSLTLPQTVRQIEYGAVSYCDDLTSLTLNDGLLVIEENCFSGNNRLEAVTIPASVCYIGNSSFSSSENLRQVTFTGKCPAFNGVCFDYLPEDTVILVPDDQFDAYRCAFEGMDLYPNLQISGKNAEVFDYSCNPEQFSFDAENGTILGFAGYDVRVDVPAEIDGVPVRHIAPGAFQNLQYMCYLSIPEGIETIGDSAFEGCTRLLHIDFPSTLKSIGSRAFAGGIQVKHLDLPEGLESIGNEAFDHAHYLSGTLEMPQGLKSIGERAFADCGWLETIYISDSVETIGENAFSDCGISYVVFEGVQLPEMPASVFTNCSYLADIDLHTSATKQQMLELQATVDSLGLSCRVWRMQNPDVDYIQDGLDSYENGVLTGYTGQQTHVRPWDNFDDIDVTAVGSGAFKDNQTIEYFAVPYNDIFTTIGAEAFAGSSVGKVDLFDSVTTIEEGAFRDCVNLEELTLPESVSSVGSRALSGCTNLRKLTVLCDPSVLPADLLEGCNPEMEIYASQSATDEQLKYLSGIAGRAWNKPVTRIGESLPVVQAMPFEPLPAADFWYDADFARIDRYDGYELNLVLPREIDGTPLTMLGGSLMSRASYGDNYEMELPVVSVVIPETYTEITPYAFANCEALETVICYAPIECLPDYAFQNCTSLREVIFVNGVHTMGAYVFDNCPNLQTVYIGPYADSISETALQDEYGTPMLELSECITDPLLMPNVDALINSVKRDPMPTPAPTATPAPAVPVGEEGKPFLGTWYGTEMDLGGDVMNLSEFDMAMTALFCEDGRMLLSDSDTIDASMAEPEDWLNWRVDGGTATCEQSVMTIMEDGRLCLEEEELKIFFVREGESAPAAENTPPAEILSESPASAEPGSIFELKYVCINADVEGYTIDASMLGGEYSLVFHENGTADFIAVGTALPGVVWEKLDDSNYQLDCYGNKMDILWTDVGFDLNYYDTMLMHFVPGA